MKKNAKKRQRREKKHKFSATTTHGKRTAGKRSRRLPKFFEKKCLTNKINVLYNVTRVKKLKSRNSYNYRKRGNSYVTCTST